MKICVPSDSSAGLDAHAHAHFGSAPFFTLIDTDTNGVEIVSNQGSHYAHGRCDPLSALRPHRLDAVVCRGMGKRALARLNQAGVSVLVVDRDRVTDIVDAVKAGEATVLTVAHACQGHQHHQRYGTHH